MEKMRFLLIICFIIFLLYGCFIKKKEGNHSSNIFPNISANPTKTSEISTLPTTELNSEQILDGNFVSIAGEYINSNGKIIFLDDDGLNDNEIQTGEIYGSQDSGFFMGIHQKMSDDGGYLLMVFPIGVEIPNLEGLTDITKVRICYGQADPMSKEEVYTKK